MIVQIWYPWEAALGLISIYWLPKWSKIYFLFWCSKGDNIFLFLIFFFCRKKEAGLVVWFGRILTEKFVWSVPLRNIKFKRWQELVLRAVQNLESSLWGKFCFKNTATKISCSSMKWNTHSEKSIAYEAKFWKLTFWTKVLCSDFDNAPSFISCYVTSHFHVRC